LSHATQPKWSVASNDEEVTASHERLAAVLSVHPHDVRAASHGQLLVVVVPGFEEHPGGCVADRGQQ